METHQGRSIPVVKDFHIEGSWAPVTPAKPNAARLCPIYEDRRGLLNQTWREQGSYLSGYNQQNCPQTVASYSSYQTPSNNVRIRGLEIPSLSEINNVWCENGEIQRRDMGENLPHWSSQGGIQRQGLEENLPHWRSQGRRSVMNNPSSNPGFTSYPRFSCWDKSGASENGTPFGGDFSDPLGGFDTMTFGDLLGMNGPMTFPNNSGAASNGMFCHGWVSQPETSSRLNNVAVLNNHHPLRGISQQMNGLYDRGMQNDALPRPSWNMGSNANLPPTAKQASGSTAFAPETPDFRQRLQRHGSSVNAHPGSNQGLHHQDILQEHEVAAAIEDLQDHNNHNISEPITESSHGKASKPVDEDYRPDKEVIQDFDLNKTPQKKPRKRRYQPKVIRENKPKVTPKPNIPNPNDFKDTQVKRKNVRKNKSNTPSTLSTEEPADPKPAEPTVKTCKRSLNFDLNGHVAEHSRLHKSNGGLDELMIKTPMKALDLNCTMNQKLNEYRSLPVTENLDYFVPCASSLEGAQTRGSKRSLSYRNDSYINIGTGAITQSPLWHSTRISSKNTHAEILPQSFIPEICKKKRTEKIQRLHIQGTSSFAAAAEDIRQLDKVHNQPQVKIMTSKYYYSNPATSGINGLTNDQEVVMRRSESMEQLARTWADLSRFKKKRTKVVTRVRDMAQLMGIASVAKDASKAKVDSMRGHYSCTTVFDGILSCSEALAADPSGIPRSKRRSKQQNSVNKNWNIVLYDKNRVTKEATDHISALPWTKENSSIEDVTILFQDLDINRQKPKTRRKEKDDVHWIKQGQGEVVLYKNAGSMVTYEGPFNPTRKKRPRARVDLDDETTRVWRLLLENIDNEGINGTDEDKAKWWEDERTVFRGRVDSFIARMRLVQGDRRFTPWKGSVLDSVIGVFLTQNVSDHLSSSAFMSMAARFPLKPESSGSTRSETTSVSFPEPEVCIFESEESITWNEQSMDQPTLGRNSRVIYDLDPREDREVVDSKELTQKTSPVSPTDCSIELCKKASNYSRAFNLNRQDSEIETPDILGDDKAREGTTSPQQSVISSQNSNNLPNPKTVGMTNIFSESNSSNQVVTTNCEFNYLESAESFMCLLKMAESSSQTHFQDQLEGMKHQTEYYQEAPGVYSSNYQFSLESGFCLKDDKGLEMLDLESRSSDISRKDENSPTTEQSNLSLELTDQEKSPETFPAAAQTTSFCYVLEGETMVMQSKVQDVKEPLDTITSSAQAERSPSCKGRNVAVLFQEMGDVTESTRGLERTKRHNKQVHQVPEQNFASVMLSGMANPNPSHFSFHEMAGATENTRRLERTETHNNKLHQVPEQNYASGVLSGMTNPNPSHFSSHEMAGDTENKKGLERTETQNKRADQIPEQNYASGMLSSMANTNPSKTGKGKAGKEKKTEFDWDSLRREAQVDGKKPERPGNHKDSLDWEAVRHANVKDIADTIKERGMNNMLAERIKDLLDRLVKDHGSTDMEWLRDIPPDRTKEYLLSFRGLGLKSVECVRLLTLHHLAFPVDTNVGRIAVRLGWVPLQPLPESLQLHLLEMYPILESIQKYLWPRLCKLDQKTLYELHYHMITFGKVFCTKRQPNCNACPLRGECRHFASAFASARFSLPGPEERSIMPSSTTTSNVNARPGTNLLPLPTSWGSDNPHSDFKTYDASANQVPTFPLLLPFPQNVHLERKSINSKCEPIVEVPASPEQEPQQEQELCDIEDTFYEDPNEIPTIDLNMEEFTQTLQNFMHANQELQEAGMSNALVALPPEAASIPTPKLKNINRLRTEHYVYELPDTHPLLHRMEKREPDDPCSYLLAIWTPGETATSIDPPARRCSFSDLTMLCNEETCSYCSSQREADSQIVRGTLLIPTRTAMRGSFPLNGTYFQVNEVFADHDSSLNPIAVPRSWLWNLPRRTVYFGSSIPTIFKGLNTEEIQHCFWRGYVCVRGFDQKTRAPRPLMARLHFPASRIARGVKGKVYNE